MNPIESVTRALGGVLNTPQAEFYLGVGFPGVVGTPPTPREKEYFLRTVKATTDTIQANRQPVRDLGGRLCVQGSPATPDILHLVSKLSRVARVCHQAGHEWPDTLDEQGRKRTLAEWGTAGDYFTGWVYMICEYFPQLVVPSTDTTNQVADPGPAVVRGATSTGERMATGPVDRDRLAGCFKGGFKMMDQATGVVPFEAFHGDFVARVPSYTPTDIGRVAYQIKASKWAVSRIKTATFSKWLRELCGICGATVPADTSPSRYKRTTPATDFTAWLG